MLDSLSLEPSGFRNDRGNGGFRFFKPKTQTDTDKWGCWVSVFIGLASFIDEGKNISLAGIAGARGGQIEFTARFARGAEDVEYYEEIFLISVRGWKSKKIRAFSGNGA